jgi:predicted MFS family arabinose efflux permease
MSSQRLPASITLLMAIQALSLCTAPLYYLAGGIVGNALAPRPSMATLPIAFIIIGTALSVLPVTRLMQRLGRKRVFVGGALANAGGGLLAAAALLRGDFPLFCAAGALAGVSIAVAQQYRFAAIETVPPALAAKATARVLLAGLVAAWLGPELAVWGEFASDADWAMAARPEHRAFLGGFLLLVGIAAAVALLVMAAYRDLRPQETGAGRRDSRPLRQLLRQPKLQLAIIAAAMGYAMMSFVMTATPLSMHTMQGHSLHDTKWVLQSHIIAMFAPSLFSGQLIGRLGHRRVIAMGAAAYVICLLIAAAGQQLLHYWWAMVLLGIGWNFLFVGGTALLAQCHRPEERFRVQSANEFAVFGCQALAALGSGWVLNAFGWGTLVVVAAIMVAAVLLGLWRADGTVGVHDATAME